MRATPGVLHGSQPYNLTFKRATPKSGKGFRYICELHPFMVGHVKVSNR